MISLLQKLYHLNIIRYGDFTFKSGAKSNIYFDLRTLISYPYLFKHFVEMIVSLIREKGIGGELICGPAYSGIPLATSVGMELDIPLVYIRKEKKEYGTGKLIEGIYQRGNECLMIDDVITTGSSLMENISILEGEGVIVKNIICIIDRRTDINHLKKYNVVSLFKFNEIQKIIHLLENPINPMTMKIYDCMFTKKTNLILAADLTNFGELVKLITIAGEHISILKIHHDIIEDFNLERGLELKKLGAKYNFFIMEDRKFADIGNTVQTQYSHIIDWADLVTVHTIMGANSVDAISNVIRENGYEGMRGMFLLAEASTQDNLITSEYTKKTIEIGEKNRENVCGYISQHKIGSENMLCATPGIKIEKGGDNKGQQYHTPQEMLKEGRVDMMIVGRGIYESRDVLGSLINYKKIGWNLYDQSK